MMRKLYTSSKTLMFSRPAGDLISYVRVLVLFATPHTYTSARPQSHHRNDEISGLMLRRSAGHGSGPDSGPGRRNLTLGQVNQAINSPS
jgi:hypothetical protein